MPTKKTTTQKIQKPELIAASLRAITTAYPKDKTSPGLVLSILKNGNFYASIVRYSEPFGQGKETIFSAKAISWQSALHQCMSEFLDAPKSMTTLAKALGREEEPDLSDGDWGYNTFAGE